ncbi:hypothetical protein JZM18_25875 [Escherichia coli]|nr:hypothetical protein [Escherichia coli]
MIKRFLKSRLKNVDYDFNPDGFISRLDNMSFSNLERVLNQAIKSMIIAKKKTLTERYLVDAINDEYRRNSGVDKMR